MVYQPYIVGLSGGSASGKTSFIEALKGFFTPSELCVISMDHYYKPLSQQLRDPNGRINFDHPEGIDFQRLMRDIRSLKKGKAVNIVEYTFNNPSVFPKEIRFDPAPILLVEGLYVFSHPPLKKMLNWRLFIQANAELAYQRRIKRDMEERGMSAEEILYQWHNHVLPSHQEHVIPHLNEVHLTIDNSLYFEDGLQLVVEKLKDMLNK